MSQVISDLCYIRGGKHRLALTCDLVIAHGFGDWGCHELYDGNTLEGIIDRDHLVILAPFGCDGCSPSWRIPFTRIHVGTWTPHASVPGCFAHDFIGKYRHLPCLAREGINRKVSDDLFWNLLHSQGFPGRDIYHGAVAGHLGSAYQRLTRGPSAIRCNCCQPPP